MTTVTTRTRSATACSWPHPDPQPLRAPLNGPRACTAPVAQAGEFFQLSYNYWLTNVYCYYAFLSIRHKGLCPRHELDVTKLVVLVLAVGYG